MQGKGWVVAKELVVGDRLKLFDGNEASIDEISTEEFDKPVKVYNFEVEDFHTYYVGSCCILVHNTCVPKSPKKLSDSALKKVDVHAFKKDIVGKHVARYDVYKDTATDIIWLGTKKADSWYNTGYTLEKLIEYYPK